RIAREPMLRHLYGEASMPCRVYAPRPELRLHVREALYAGSRHLDLRMGFVYEAPIRRPRLDHEIEAFGRLKRLREVARHVGPIAKRERDLLQLVVEH